jgi:hypothetical protein
LPNDEFPKSLGGIDFISAQAFNESADNTSQPEHFDSLHVLQKSCRGVKPGLDLLDPAPLTGVGPGCHPRGGQETRYIGY